MSQLRDRRRESVLFRRLAAKAGIEHRYSHIVPTQDPGGEVLDIDGLFVRGRFPGTGTRMRFFERHAPDLAAQVVDRVLPEQERHDISHLLVTCCTGLSSPGLDLDLIDRCGLSSSVERSVLGFMGCYAAINALKLARHIVRSEPEPRVLVVSLELCTVHLKETTDLEDLLSFLLWGDGAAACLVTAEPKGFALDGFHAVLAADTRRRESTGPAVHRPRSLQGHATSLRESVVGHGALRARGLLALGARRSGGLCHVLRSRSGGRKHAISRGGLRSVRPPDQQKAW
jgi:predicted naringenin-chalcone synthase